MWWLWEDDFVATWKEPRDFPSQDRQRTEVWVYENYMVIRRPGAATYVPFDGTWSWDLTREGNYWVLHFVDAEQNKLFVGLPNDEYKDEVEGQLKYVGMPRPGAPLVTHAEANKRLLSAINVYRPASQRFQAGSIKWYGLVLFLNILAAASVLYYIEPDAIVLGVAIFVVLLEVVILACVHFLLLKSVVKKAGLVCRHCWKVPLPGTIEFLAATHVCPRCRHRF